MSSSTRALLLALALAASVRAEPIRLLTQEHDPYGFPRPAPGQENVPLRTSFFFELGFDRPDSPDRVVADSVAVTLQPQGGEAVDVLKAGGRFAPGYSGRLFPAAVGFKGQPTLAVYIASETPLKPSTTYTIRVSARSQSGAELPFGEDAWGFTTEASPVAHSVSVPLDLDAPAVTWHGAFFSGFGKVNFCASDPDLIGTYELMADTRRRFPTAWSLQRDFWLTGMELKPSFLPNYLPNIVRELETRRIVAMERQPDGILLKLEDFFGHEQYGIPAGRPLREDYHPGDEILISDGVHDARAKVLAVADAAGTILASPFDTPKDGWLLTYTSPPAATENPHAPGVFPPGGCYLLKFRPGGTPRYYWGRLDKEWDIAQRRFGRRLVVNFADAPGDLAVDGRNWTTAKDYVELHDVVRTITDHILGRYGDACLDFVWSIFNEPDLGALFWRSDWNELQRFYDYSTDAILRAFEDRGYDSNRVLVGGLELGAVFGTHLRLEEFLDHCSPRAQAAGALPTNAAFADRRLDGRRSRRVEALCRRSNGKGAPCDFISVHAYNRSELMAAKLLRAKEIALTIDPEYYAKLRVHSHEACPSWMPPPDPAAADSYLGNGYFPTWCADVARRQLQAAADDPRYAFGETILTFWPWPTENFAGYPTCTRLIRVDDDGDGAADRKVLVPMPIFHFLGLLNSMGNEYQVIRGRTCGGHVFGGFASRTGRDVRILLYAHDPLDTQSRSDQEFAVSLDIRGIPWPQVHVDEYRFDRDHNTCFRLARELRDRPPGRPGAPAVTAAEVDDLARTVESGNRDAVLAALKKLGAIGPAAQSATPTVFRLLGPTTDATVRAAAQSAIARIAPSQICYDPKEIAEIQALAMLHTTRSSTHVVAAGGRLTLPSNLKGNGAVFLVVEPAGPTSRAADP